MNKMALPAALLAACGLAQAQAPNAAASGPVQIYGTVDLAVGQIETQPPGAPNAAIERVRGLHSGALQTSYFGIRGSRELAPGVRARFQLEGFFRADVAKTGRFDASPSSEADPFFSREAFAAIGGPFGELRAGNNGNPVWVTMLQSNALGANSVFSPSFRQLFNGGTRGRSEADTSMTNSLKYVSPVIAGFEGSLLWEPGEGRGDGANVALNAGWRAGPLALGVATQSLRHAAPPALAGSRDQTITLLGGSYDLGFMRLFGQYTTISNSRLNTKDKLPHFGFTVPLGAGVVQFSTGQDKATATAPNGTQAITKRTTTSLGYVYALFENTDLYSFVMSDRVAVGTAESLVVGLRYRF